MSLSAGVISSQAAKPANPAPSFLHTRNRRRRDQLCPHHPKQVDERDLKIFDAFLLCDLRQIFSHVVSPALLSLLNCPSLRGFNNSLGPESHEVLCERHPRHRRSFNRQRHQVFPAQGCVRPTCHTRRAMVWHSNAMTLRKLVSRRPAATGSRRAANSGFCVVMPAGSLPSCQSS